MASPLSSCVTPGECCRLRPPEAYTETEFGGQDVYEGSGLRKARQEPDWLEEGTEVRCRSDTASANPDCQYPALG